MRKKKKEKKEEEETEKTETEAETKTDEVEVLSRWYLSLHFECLACLAWHLFPLVFRRSDSIVRKCKR